MKRDPQTGVLWTPSDYDGGIELETGEFFSYDQIPVLFRGIVSTAVRNEYDKEKDHKQYFRGDFLRTEEAQ